MPCTMRPCQVLLPADPTAPRLARDFLRGACCSQHPTEVVEEAQLLVSELVTNAVRHGSPPIELQVRCAGDDALEIRVRDANPAPPERRAVNLDAEGGRGLMLVDLVSQTWGSDQNPDDGKSVWFTLKV